MASNTDRAFLKRLRRYNLSGRGQTGVFTPSMFFERLYADPNTQLESRDFLHHYLPGTKEEILEIYSNYKRFGRRPFSKHYLISMIVEGDCEARTVTYHIYEYRFSGLLALHRRPLWRKREITIPVKEFGASFEQSHERWTEDIDKGWEWNFGRVGTDRLEAIASRLNI